MPTGADELKRLALFSDLNGRQLKRLTEHARERTLAPGTVVVREGTMSGIGFFVVLEGDAIVTVGGEQVLTLGPGDHFGELAAVTERERAATVTVRSPMRCLEIPLWDLREFAQANGDFTWKLLQHVVHVLRLPDAG